MGACLAKSDKLSTRKQSSPPPPPGHAELPPLSSQAGIRTKNLTDDDGLAVPNVEYPRTRTFYDKVLKRDSDKASAKLMRGSSSRQNGRVSNSDMRLQGMSSAELVEQYSLDASQLMDSVARLERVRAFLFIIRILCSVRFQAKREADWQPLLFQYKCKVRDGDSNQDHTLMEDVHFAYKT